MLKNTTEIIKKKNFFLNISMGTIRYSYPLRLVPTYILPAKEIRFFEKP